MATCCLPSLGPHSVDKGTSMFPPHVSHVGEKANVMGDKEKFEVHHWGEIDVATRPLPSQSPHNAEEST